MKIKLLTKCLSKIVLTASLSSIVLISLSSYREYQIKAETIYRFPINKHIQGSASAERKILAMNTKNVEKFGNDFLMAWKAGRSAQFIPDKVELDEFLYSVFGSEYTKLSIQDKNIAKFNLFDSFKALHTNPALIDEYKKMIFKKEGLSKEGGSPKPVRMHCSDAQRARLPQCDCPVF
jgi:hypothetical protein